MKKLLVALWLLFLAPIAAQAQQIVVGNGNAAQVSGTFNAGDLTVGGGPTTIKDTLFFDQNGGVAMSGGGTPAYLVGGSPCRWSDIDSCTIGNVYMRERVFFGDAVAGNDTRNTFPTNTWWQALPTTAQGSYYLLRDAQVASMTDFGSIAISGMARSSQGDSLAGLKPAPIGVAGYVYCDTAIANSNCWGMYGEAIYNPNGVAGLSFAAELDTRNMTATNTVGNAYSVGQGDIALWIGAGAGEGSGTGAPNPSVAAIVTVSNTQTFNSGIIFHDGSLTKDGSSNSVAVEMGQGATLRWDVSSGVLGANLRSTVSTSGDDMSLVFANNQILLESTGGAALLNINQAQTVTLPTIAFPTCGTNCGILSTTSNGGAISFITAGAKWLDFSGTSSGVITMDATVSMGGQALNNGANISSNNTSGYRLVSGASSATAPTLVPNVTAPTTGIGAQAAGNVSVIDSATEVARFIAGGLVLPTIATGTPAASVCIDASNNVIKKTTTGSCV